MSFQRAPVPAVNPLHIREMKDFVKRYEEHWRFEEEINVY